MRWVEAYFPFTEPSFELEIFFNGEHKGAAVALGVVGRAGTTTPWLVCISMSCWLRKPRLGRSAVPSMPRLALPQPPHYTCYPAAGEWLEVLGCGVMQQPILDKNLGPGQKAWAFG